MNDLLDFIRPALAGMAWPAVPDDVGARALAMQFQLEQSQWWSAAELEHQQMRQLQLLLRHAHETSPFWRNRLGAAGYTPELAVTPEWLRSLPLLTRADIQAHGDVLASRAVPREHGATSKSQTSGSTGIPIEFAVTDVTNFFWSCFTLREHLWHQRGFGGKLAAIRLGLTESEGSGWGQATDVVFNTGPYAALNITADIDYQLTWLARQNPDYLLSFPSNLDELARRSLDRGIRIPRLREVRAVGEVLSPHTRLLVREAWDVAITDLYSAKEIGYIALQCPGYEQYHVQSEGVVVEIINDAGAPCGPGEIGRVALTSLHNFAMPLIRYLIGDLAEPGTACACGRGLPVIRRIYGRVRNMLTSPDGRKNWPSLGDMRRAAGDKIRQYQCIQRSLEQIDVLMVVKSPLNSDEENELRSTMQKALGYPFDLKFIYRESIDRFRSGKFEEFRSEL